MNTITIIGEKRENLGKKSTYKLRKIDRVPCVIYGTNICNIQFSIYEKFFKKLIYTKEVYKIIIDLYPKNNHNKENDQIETILQDIQFHPVSDKILHADFYQLNKNKPIILNIPIKIFGKPIGLDKGGEYYSPLKKLKIKSLPINLPNYIPVDISKLDIGDRILIKEIYTKKYTILHPDNAIIAIVKASRTSIKTEESEIKEEKKKK